MLTIKTDLTVVGAGIAGMCAAVAAAIEGLNVALINDRPVLGGNASSEIGVGIEGASHQGFNPAIYAKETGLIEELRQMIEEYNQNKGYGELGVIDAVFFDYIYNEPNIKLYLNTTVMDTKVVEGKIESVSAYHSKSEEWYCFESPVFADCSGDGIVGFKAGAQYKIGNDSKSEYNEFWAPETANTNTMGNTIYFEIEDCGKEVGFQRPNFAYDITKLEFMKWIDKAENFRNFYVSGKFWTLEVGGDLNTIKDYENITLDLRKLAYGIWDYIKNSGKFPKAKNYKLVRMYSIAGSRESRRFIGDYVLTENDIENNILFDDSIAIGGWPMDVHATKGIYDEKPASNFIPVTGVYDIPYRCLYSKNIANLFFAGRNISATHIALGSTRVMATCGCLGQAVGTAAYLCVKNDILPNCVNTNELRSILYNKDQSIRGYCTPDDSWEVNASSVLSYENVEIAEAKVLNSNLGLSLPIVTDKLNSIDVKLKCGNNTKLLIDILSGDIEDAYLPNKLVYHNFIRSPYSFYIYYLFSHYELHYFKVYYFIFRFIFNH
jgi:hypothetical protein